MTTAAYRVELRLESAVGLGPEWLPVAVRSSLPDAELVSVESYNDAAAVVLIRAASRPAVGQALTPGAEGVSLPLVASPRGTVVNVSDAVEQALPPTTPGKAAVSVLAAVGLLAVVWYLVSRIS